MRHALPSAYRPHGVSHDIVIPDIASTSEALWVPQAEGVAFLPLCLSPTQGYYVNLLRVRKSGVLSCHRHSGTVHAHVLKGRWYYKEHDWEAAQGSYIMEPPGETHTLIVPPDVDEMVTWFHVTGGYTYLDEKGQITGIEDVFTKLERARQHYADSQGARAHLERIIR